ncbi:MAG: TetR/AcrR family transcriptional regulator [Deltaproteobacteria bacterium]|nr:TetR/AcrR family transcriptional regulator [Deltaproteobacteria bacterium]
MAIKNDDKVEQILNSARELLAAHGIKNTTMEHIAAKAGVAKPLLYRYIGNKDDIVASVIEEEINQLKRSIQDGLNEEKNPIGKMAKMWSNALDYYQRDSFLMLLLKGNELPLPPYMYEKYITEIEKFVVDLIENTIQEGIAMGVFVECDSKIAAYMGYKLYQAGTYGKTEILEGFTPKQIMKRTIQILGKGILKHEQNNS